MAGLGLFLVLQSHTSVGSFDPTESNSVGDFYTQILGELTTPITELQQTTHTLVLANANNYLRCTNTNGCAITVPPNSSVVFDLTTEINIRQVTPAGSVSLVAGAGVTLNGVAGFDLATDGQGATFQIKQVAIDEWDVFGLLAETSA